MDKIMEVKIPLPMNINCPLCQSMMVMINTEEGPPNGEGHLQCKRVGCGYYNVMFKFPTVTIEATEEGKELLIERSIISKEW